MMTHHERRDAQIDPKRAVPKEEYEKAEKVFVGGLPPDLEEQEFRDFFKAFGTVTDATIMHDRNTGRPRGFGFVTFSNWDGVQKAMDMQAAQGIFLKNKQVEVKPASLRTQQQIGYGAQGGYAAFGGFAGYGRQQFQKGGRPMGGYPNAGYGGQNNMYAAQGYGYPPSYYNDPYAGFNHGYPQQPAGQMGYGNYANGGYGAAYQNGYPDPSLNGAYQGRQEQKSPAGEFADGREGSPTGGQAYGQETPSQSAQASPQYEDRSRGSDEYNAQRGGNRRRELGGGQHRGARRDQGGYDRRGGRGRDNRSHHHPYQR